MEQTVEILMGIRERYEQHHKVTITDDAVRAAADLSIRYITDRHLPDKAIDLIDEAAQPRPAPPRIRAAGAARGPEGPRADHQGEGRGDQRPGVRGGGDPARVGGDRAREGRDRCAAEWQSQVSERPADRRRGGDRPGRGDVDRHPGHPDRRGGVGAPAPHGGGAARPRHRPAGGDRDRLEGRPPRPRRPQGPEAPDRLVHLPRPDRRREDGACQGARGVHVRQRGRAHQDRHERVHGAPQRQPPGRRPSGLRRASTRAAS